jgi:transcriptional regulator with GAF, ATPase, and Fis domain
MSSAAWSELIRCRWKRPSAITAWLRLPGQLGDGAIERFETPRHLRVRHERSRVGAHVSSERRLKLRPIEKQVSVLRRQDWRYRRTGWRVLDRRGHGLALVRSERRDIDKARDVWIVAGFRDHDTAVRMADENRRAALRGDERVMTTRAGGTGMAGPLIGNSVAFREVTEAIAMVAPVDSAVLLLGETGTGKEVIARASHDAGPRRHQRFVAVNCAAIPVSLLESELFGHERGAFTGAVSQTVGRFQAADRGTLLLDEVGDLPLELQPKLLRVLQDQQIERLGSGGRATSVDVRVIAATNQDLEGMVPQRAFRADLFYRLNVFPIRVPPLRERTEDIPLLVAPSVRRFAERQGKCIEEIPDTIIDTLRYQAWPGNVRELQNVIERAVIATTGRTLQMPNADRRVHRPASPARTLAELERDHILTILDATKWVIGGWNGAAAKLGLSRTTLIFRMQRLGIAARNGVADNAPHPALPRTARACAAYRQTLFAECPG